MKGGYIGWHWGFSEIEKIFTEFRETNKITEA